MDFGDLSSKEGVKRLDEALADKSYLQGYTPSALDASAFDALSGAPGAAFVNALRWWNQINSYKANERSSWPGCTKVAVTKPVAAAVEEDDDDSDSDDDDLFGEETPEQKAEKARIREERLAAYAAKKSKKPGPIAKSNIILDVKPWDDETDMKELEQKVRSIVADGLVWGAAKLVPLAYGIQKLQISCVVEDDKISTDFLEEEIIAFEDYVQSMDIAAFNKV